MYKSLIEKCVSALTPGRAKPVLIPRAKRRHSYDSLEERRMLAVTYTLDAGVLTILSLIHI